MVNLKARGAYRKNQLIPQAPHARRRAVRSEKYVSEDDEAAALVRREDSDIVTGFQAISRTESAGVLDFQKLLAHWTPATSRYRATLRVVMNGCHRVSSNVNERPRWRSLGVQEGLPGVILAPVPYIVIIEYVSAEGRCCMTRISAILLTVKCILGGYPNEIQKFGNSQIRQSRLIFSARY